jgi:hypothetical protein
MIIDMWERMLSERNGSQRHFIHHKSHTVSSSGWFSAVLSTTCAFYSQNPKKGPTIFWNVMLYNLVKGSRPTSSHLPLIITDCPYFGHVLLFRTQHSVSETKFPSVLAVPRIRQLVTGLLPRRPGIKPRPLHVGIYSGRNCTGACFARSSSVFLCHYHSTNDPKSSFTTCAMWVSNCKRR